MLLEESQRGNDGRSEERAAGGARGAHLDASRVEGCLAGEQAHTQGTAAVGRDEGSFLAAECTEAHPDGILTRRAHNHRAFRVDAHLVG